MPVSHLNLFRFYSAGDEPYIENNLTRGLAIVLREDPLFRDLFLSRLVGNHHELLDLMYGTPEISVDVQVPVGRIDVERRIVAVSLTRTDFTDAEWLAAVAAPTEFPVADMVVRYADVCIVVEVKLDATNCLSQLKGQIERIIDREDVDAPDVAYRSLSWPAILMLLERVHAGAFGKVDQSRLVTQHFLDFVKESFPEWYPAKPLSKIGSVSEDAQDRIQKRLVLIKKALGCQLNGTSGRDAISLSWPIASEANFSLVNAEPGGIGHVLVCFWPGDTKRQGTALWCDRDDHAWLLDDSIEFSGQSYRVVVEPYFKFSHFQRGVTWLHPGVENASRFLGRDFFSSVAGRCRREDWPLLEARIDTVVPGWRDLCSWGVDFIDSNRNYVDVTVGAAYRIEIPFATFRELDNEQLPSEGVKGLVRDAVNALGARFGLGNVI